MSILKVVRKFIYIFIFVLITSCSSDSEIQEEALEVDNSIETSTTTVVTTTVPETTTTTGDLEEISDAFLAYYLENKINGYIQLTDDELKKTYDLHMNAPSTFQLDNLICYYRTSGTANEALLDEFFPVHFENDWFFDPYYTVESDSGEKFVYWLDATYYCNDPNIDSENKDYIPIYGFPFYQEGKWWAFSEKEFEPVPVKTPGFYANWATRVEVKDFESTFTEWVIDAVPPKVRILNCPEETITDDSYEVDWEIESGNADINYLFIGYNKNGEYETRVYFEKENVPDAFPYPLSNTTTQFSTPVENTGDEGITTKDITIIVSDEYNNDAYINCLITFER